LRRTGRVDLSIIFDFYYDARRGKAVRFVYARVGLSFNGIEYLERRTTKIVKHKPILLDRGARKGGIVAAVCVNLLYETQSLYVKAPDRDKTVFLLSLRKFCSFFAVFCKILSNFVENCGGRRLE